MLLGSGLMIRRALVRVIDLLVGGLGAFYLFAFLGSGMCLSLGLLE